MPNDLYAIYRRGDEVFASLDFHEPNAEFLGGSPGDSRQEALDFWNRAHRHVDRRKVGQAKLARVRVAFQPSRTVWEYRGQRISYSHGAPGAVRLSDGEWIDLQTGAVYREERSPESGG